MPGTTTRALIALSMLIACGSASAFGGRTDWREMTVGHFKLFSTLSDSSTRDIARQLQAFEKTVGEMLRSNDRLPDVPTLIYIMNGRDFLRYAAGRSNLGGFPSVRRTTPRCSAVLPMRAKRSASGARRAAITTASS